MERYRSGWFHRLLASTGANGRGGRPGRDRVHLVSRSQHAIDRCFGATRVSGSRPVAARTLIFVVVASFATLIAASCDPTTPPAAAKFDWGLLDKDAGQGAELLDGGNATLDPAHRYVVTFRANDPKGVSKVSHYASGTFKCQTDVDQNGQSFTLGGLRVSIRSVETAINPGLYYGFVMGPEFRPDRLSCGKHANSGQVREYFVGAGTLEVTGQSTNHAGETVTAKVQLRI
ncbi:hypothetical protein ACFVYA_36230 [Amycolatopsis sp. NPDC058278]|uniref:hypothetical protein n=1 Tax=Amycolatopsis sp. NPDC058278 TaxID=3346417 RepID=UPI0036DEA146